MAMYYETASVILDSFNPNARVSPSFILRLALQLDALWDIHPIELVEILAREDKVWLARMANKLGKCIESTCYNADDTGEEATLCTVSRKHYDSIDILTFLPKDVRFRVSNLRVAGQYIDGRKRRTAKVSVVPIEDGVPDIRVAALNRKCVVDTRVFRDGKVIHREVDKRYELAERAAEYKATWEETMELRVAENPVRKRA